MQVDDAGSNAPEPGADPGERCAAHYSAAESSLPQQPGVTSHAAAEGAPLHPLIDLSRDPNPGVPNHAAPED